MYDSCGFQALPFASWQAIKQDGDPHGRPAPRLGNSSRGDYDGVESGRSLECLNGQ